MFIWDWFTGVLGFLGESLFTNNIYLFQNFPVNIESTFGDKYGHTTYNYTYLGACYVIMMCVS